MTAMAIRPGPGLDEAADTVYRTMLRARHWVREDLADRLGWPVDQLDAVVTELIADGLVAASAELPDALRAVDPALALPALAARRSRGPQSAVDVARYATERPKAFSGLDDAVAYVERLTASVKSEVVQLVPAYLPGSFEFSRQVAEAVLRRGATLRAVWSSAILEEPGAAEHAAWLAARWSAPRVVDAVPMRATVVDGITAVLHDEQGHAGVIRGARALDSLSRAAERLWARGVEVTAARTKPETPPADARNELVLRLLADGLTDDAIARRIGVSVRTVRNDVAGTMAKLKARSRFQAGVRAVQLGLI
ncbi:LuxR C-terminal-related transcriptional regulator [Actinokineospora fastidiosa]|uniref:HTH luxR-type domain-containing protein n=1 Tax=Actinokineospora fastidiosa TaxID=1816 RepID=A0A918GGJ9_9PSEU|nr:LuxR C-terminal-related transcriptional regulator [Actinokineospora fastidiosa]GGS36276.1 hypothetical protein GCM10010171_33640 [Actinokineospora fastidiosa]